MGLFIKIRYQWLEKLNEILSKHTGQKVDKIVKDSDRDNFMSPDEAVKYGLIDAVVDTRNKD